jgi:alkanesulfonate monooxygenase
MRLFTTCPQSRDVDASAFSHRVAEAAGWSETIGCHGMLIYTDNGLVDPWLAAQLVIQSTDSLSPLVAVQPVYMHPYSAAKKVASLAYMHGRRIDLNMVAGGFRNDLLSLGDDTSHDDRYARVIEYAQIVTGLLASATPFSFQGAYYRLTNVRMRPPVPPELLPGVVVSGSSPAGLAAARVLGATAVRYPQPAHEEDGVLDGEPIELGIRMGIIARESEEEAWAEAHARFPGDRKGQLAHQLAMRVSDSHWHRQLSSRPDDQEPRLDPYWLWPFQNYRTFCPYLVGGYDRVAAEIRRYLERGFTACILDIPTSLDDLHHTRTSFEKAIAVLRE